MFMCIEVCVSVRECVLVHVGGCVCLCKNVCACGGACARMSVLVCVFVRVRE